MEWEPAIDEEISAYHIYRAVYDEISKTQTPYQLHCSLGIESLISMSHLDEDIERGLKYSYKLLAQNTSETYSAFSDTVSYMRISRIGIDHMTPNGNTDTLRLDRKLSWSFYASIEMEDYCLTIISDSDQLLYRKILIPGTYIYGTESGYIPDSIHLETGRIYRWRIDMNAMYIDGFESAGSESQWASFLYSSE